MKASNFLTWNYNSLWQYERTFLPVKWDITWGVGRCKANIHFSRKLPYMNSNYLNYRHNFHFEKFSFKLLSYEAMNSQANTVTGSKIYISTELQWIINASCVVNKSITIKEAGFREQLHESLGLKGRVSFRFLKSKLLKQQYRLPVRLQWQRSTHEFYNSSNWSNCSAPTFWILQVRKSPLLLRNIWRNARSLIGEAMGKQLGTGLGKTEKGPEKDIDSWDMEK